MADWVERRFAVTVDPELEVLLLVGSQEGTAHLPLAVLNPGERALVLDPCYPSHASVVCCWRGVNRCRCPWRPGMVGAPAFERLPLEQQRQLRLLVLGYPHNPTPPPVVRTGWTRPWPWRLVMMPCWPTTTPMWIWPWRGSTRVAAQPRLVEHGIEFFSFSKGWALAGFRLAFAVGQHPD